MVYILSLTISSFQQWKVRLLAARILYYNYQEFFNSRI